MKHRKQMLIKGCCFMACSLIFLLGISVLNVNAVEPVKIGVVQPLTGKFASYGEPTLAGAKFAAKLINDAGGIKSLGGAKIEVVAGDDQSSTQMCKTQLELLLSREKVSGIIGPFTSGMCKATAGWSDQYKVPFITTSSPEGAIYGHQFRLKYFYCIAGTTENYGVNYGGLLDWLVKKHGLKVKKVGLMFPDNTYGKAVAKALRKAIPDRGYTIAIEVPYDWRASDFSPYILKLKHAGVDVILQVSYFKDGVNSNKARYNQDFYPVVIGGIQSFVHDSAWRALGGEEVAKKTLGGPTFGCNWFEEAQNYKPFTKLLDQARAAGYKFGGREGLDRVWFGGGAQGMYCFKAALEKAGSRSGEKINRELKTLKLERGNANLIIPLFNPALEWDEFGGPLNETFVFIQWVDGKKFIVYPAEYAQMPPRLR